MVPWIWNYDYPISISFGVSEHRVPVWYIKYIKPKKDAEQCATRTLVRWYFRNISRFFTFWHLSPIERRLKRVCPIFRHTRLSCCQLYQLYSQWYSIKSPFLLVNSNRSNGSTGYTIIGCLYDESSSFAVSSCLAHRSCITSSLVDWEQAS